VVCRDGNGIGDAACRIRRCLNQILRVCDWVVDMILRPTTDLAEGVLSPEALKYKVIVKGSVEAPEFEELMWMKSKKFTKFSDMYENALPWNVCSYTEASKPILDNRMAPLTAQCFARVYPDGDRFSSSNYNPEPMWTVGCQLVW
jgi:hypothetical protein